MNEPAAAKLKMLQASVRCLVFGLLGLLPVIGLPFALAALWLSGRVRRQEKRFWNAAQPHRMIGVACAALGAAGWFVIGVLIAFQAISSSRN